MKVNFKRMITVLAATAMCAVPMTSAMSASAEEMLMMSSGRRTAVAEMTTLSKARVDSVGYFLPETDPDDIPWPIRIRARKAYRITSRGSKEVSIKNGRVGKLAPDTNPDDIPWWIIIVAASDAKEIKASDLSRNIKDKMAVVEFSGATGLYTQDPPSWWVGSWPPKNPVADGGVSIAQGRLSQKISLASAASISGKEASVKFEKADLNGYYTVGMLIENGGKIPGGNPAIV